MNIHLLDLTTHRSKRKSPTNDRINPPRLLLEAFLSLIALGACLLKLPTDRTAG